MDAHQTPAIIQRLEFMKTAYFVTKNCILSLNCTT